MKKNYCFFIVSLLCINSFYGQKDTTNKKVIDLQEVIISNKNNGVEQINAVDFQLRPTNSAQDLLRLVPGLFIAQHAGGGKAEQIFLRGFDADHGTDFSVNIDGMPVNMVSHAHGQGYADFHFVIPETVDRLDVYKGPFNAAYGDFATSGAGEFSTKNKLDKSLLRMEYGSFNTYRTLLMIDLLKDKKLFAKQNENFYLVADYNFSDSYFESKQYYNRYNFFTKYSAQINSSNFLSISASAFYSAWDASGQIPERKVADNTISRFGSIDNTEGGNTSRINFNSALTTVINPKTTLKNRFYYSNYDFNLYSNFTFNLRDSINGDQINQQDRLRNIFGYKTYIENDHKLVGKNSKLKLGIGTRIDLGENALYYSVKRKIRDTAAIGSFNVQNYFIYLDETINLNEKLQLNLATRYDLFYMKTVNFINDSLSGNLLKGKASPKASLFYNAFSNIQFYLKAGFGFHSNDARGSVINKNETVLPTAFGYELGGTFKLGKKIIINTALWGLDLENELVYVGDEAITENSDATRRLGADFAVRLQLSSKLFFDGDLNYSYGRFIDLKDKENYIPLAPSLTSVAGLSYKGEKLTSSLRYRYVNNRPANEDNSVTALGYFLLDATTNYNFKKIQIGFTLQNILNTKWNEAQFDTETKLKDETTATSELHYTPGAPFNFKIHFGVNF